MPSTQIKTIDSQELSKWLKGANPELQNPVVLDVREPWEYDTCHLPDSLHIPMGEVPSRFNEMNLEAPIVCLCHHGVRSLQVAYFLVNHGFTNVYNMRGGIHAWSLEVDTSLPTY